MEFNDKLFEDDKFVVDGNTYNRCVFIRCKFVYRATAPVVMNDCQLAEPEWVLAGAAQQTIRFLREAARASSDMGELIAARIIFPGIDEWLKPEALQLLTGGTTQG